MSRRAAEREEEDVVARPRETTALFGHGDAEQLLLNAYRSGRIPHAWLIGGPPGIGKATIAYRLARFVLAHPDPAAAPVRAATSLAVAPDHPIARRLAALSHSDLLVLERTLNERGKLRTEIAVDDVRRSVPFFGSTAGEGGWRVCVVDSADELNKYGANALLKILEEPPKQSLLILVSNSPGRLLPTIRSRCRTLWLRPLATDDVVGAAATALAIEPDDDLRRAAAQAAGSVARAIALYDTDVLALRERVTELLARLPQLDAEALHALGDKLGRSEEASFDTFLDIVRDWLSAQLTGRPTDVRRLAQIAAAWDQFNRAADDVQIYNLERKPLVFTAFGLLANAARG